MSDNPALDVGIGLILMYLILSMLCTTINEFVATFLSLRSKLLKKALTEIIDDPDLNRDFYNHGLIASLSMKANAHPSYLAGRTFATALLGSLEQNNPLPGFMDIQAAVSRMKDSNIRDALLMHIATANGKLDALRDNIATSFDNSMDRLTGNYKRNLKAISFAVGAVIAISLNANTISISEFLWQDQGMRSAAVGLASTVSRADNAVTSGANYKIGDNDVVEFRELKNQFKTQLNEMQVFPFGWDPVSNPAARSNIFVMVIGLLITALALSLGAPFWFDLLSRIMNLRGTGEKPKPTA